MCNSVLCLARRFAVVPCCVAFVKAAICARALNAVALYCACLSLQAHVCTHKGPPTRRPSVRSPKWLRRLGSWDPGCILYSACMYIIGIGTTVALLLLFARSKRRLYRREREGRHCMLLLLRQDSVSIACYIPLCKQPAEPHTCATV